MLTRIIRVDLLRYRFALSLFVALGFWISDVIVYDDVEEGTIGIVE